MKHLHGSQEIEEYKKKRYAKMIKSYVKTAPPLRSVLVRGAKQILCIWITKKIPSKVLCKVHKQTMALSLRNIPTMWHNDYTNRQTQRKLD